MTQNPSNNEDLQATIAGLKDALEKEQLKVVMHEALWKSCQKILEERNEDINTLEKQVELYKQEFADASASNLQLLKTLDSLKQELEYLLQSLNK